MPHRTYTPPASFFERTRCHTARILIAIVWTLGLFSVKLLPRAHPFRIYATERLKHTRGLGIRACGIHSRGRLVPVLIPATISAWLMLDATSRHVTGPFDWAGWDLDEQIRIIDRAKSLVERAPLFAGLLG